MAKKIIVNGYAYSWRDLRHRLDRVRIRLPQAMADAARNFFVDSFTKQGWDTGHGIKKWKPRKKSDGRRRRAILVKTGRLRKSIRIRRATFRRITIAAEAPYAAAHRPSPCAPTRAAPTDVYKKSTPRAPERSGHARSA
mgnify:CR=1 FL=1